MDKKNNYRKGNYGEIITVFINKKDTSTKAVGYFGSICSTDYYE